MKNDLTVVQRRQLAIEVKKRARAEADAAAQTTADVEGAAPATETPAQSVYARLAEMLRAEDASK